MAKALTINAKSTSSKNPLNSYRSYTYIFTIASLSKTALTDPLSYRENQDYFVIAKSGGKGSRGIRAPDDAEKEKLVTDFNKNSPGRFDFYINNVHIETVMGQNAKTSLSVATNITFDIVEPYSMSGFIEALQVSAVAAGHTQYSNCPYLLKMEFVGYPDDLYLPETAEVVPHSTRYFVFGFTGLDITVSEEGAKYQCKAVPYNEKGFGNPSVMKNGVQITGNTVGEVLANFEKALNEAAQSDAKATRKSTDSTKCDEYRIITPMVDATGIVADSVNTVLADCKGIELLKDNAVYKFPEPDVQNTASNFVKYDPTKSVIMFAERANVHECIVSIVRDSDYVKNLLKDFVNKVDPDTGMVDYFMVHLEMEEKGVTDDTETHKPFYIYRYLVIPYKMHYSRIPNTTLETVDTSKLVTVVNRQYDYIYSGKNIDIKKFDLKFNTLFFQAIPPALGNKKEIPASVSGSSNELIASPALYSKPSEEVEKSKLGVSQVKVAPDFSQIIVNDVQNAGQMSSDPYAALAKNLHQAVLNNVDQCTADIEIIGDPYYLVTGSMGNYKPKINADGSAGDGEAPYTTRDVMIIVTFRTPSDIDKETGLMIFDQVTAPYSGVFRVISVMSDFKDGEFTQKLSLVRLPAQLVDTTIAPKAKVAAPFESTPLAIDAPTPRTPEPKNTIRAAGDSLLASITSGLPVAGLPGNLSQLVPSSIGGLADNISSLAGNLSNSISSAVSAASNAVGSAAAGMVTWGATAASAGVPNITGETLASTTLASGLGSAADIGTSAMSAASRLGSGAGDLLSGVGSKVAGLTSGNASIAGSLGIDTSSLSGLSADLQSKAAESIAAAIKTIPDGVNVNQAVGAGLILNNIPKSALANIPVTQPIAIAPIAETNLSDIKAILDRGGSLANLPGASSIPGVSSLLSSANITLPSGLGLDADSVAGKLSSAQAGLSSITGQIPSIESSIGSISSMVPSGLPNVSDIGSSVVNKFGSISAAASSPLSTLMKSV